MAVEIFIHKMTEHMDRATILGWRVREGERVEQYQIIMDVETEKATVELESPAAGIVKGIRLGAVAGAEVPVGEPLAFIAAPDEAVPSLPPLGATAGDTAPAVPPAVPEAAPEQAPAGTAGNGGLRATPIARRMAKDLGVDLALVRGSGPGGRIREEDVRTFAASLKTPAPAAAVPETAATAPVAAGDGAWLELTAAQRVTGERMLESVRVQPQFTLELSVDMSQLLWLRERLASGEGDRPSITAFLVKAVAALLAKHPRLNAEFRDGRVYQHRQANVGVAVGGESGLFVPVVRDAGAKTPREVQREIAAFQEKAAARRLSPADLEGGTFTISNLGMYGIERFNAILNPPQSAILAVGKIVSTPVGLADGSIALRPMMRLSLTIDHRVMDGLHGAAFLRDLKESLEGLTFLV